MVLDRAIWSVPLVLSVFVVIANVHSIVALRRRHRRSFPVRSCRPLAFALLGVDLVRGTSGFCTNVFALAPKTDPLPVLRLCRLLAFVHQWLDVTSCCVAAIFLFEGHALQLDPTAYFRRARATALVGAAGCYGFVTSFLPIVGWDSYSYYRKLSVCEIEDRSSTGYQMFLLVFGTLVPLLSGVLVYVKLLLLALRPSPRVGPVVDLHDVIGSDALGGGRVFDRRLSAGSESFGYSGRRGAILFAFFCMSWIYVGILRCLFICKIVDQASDSDLWIYVTMTTVGLMTSLVNPLTLVGLRGLARSLRLFRFFAANLIRNRSNYQQSARRCTDSNANGDRRHDNGCLATTKPETVCSNGQTRY